VQTNCLCNFNNCFLFVVVIAIVVVVVVALAFALAFALVFAFVFAFIFLASIFVFLASFALFFSSLSLIIILFAFHAFFNSLLNRNIERTCKLKKIKTRLTIYNSNLILLLRICS